MPVTATPVRATQEGCIPAERVCISGRFLEFWEQNGGVETFGFATSPARDERDPATGRIYLVQWFERARFELHPENSPPYDVLFTRLGDDRLEQLGRDSRATPKMASNTPHYFAQTGFAIAPQFWDRWRSQGLELGDPGVSERESIALWGLPLSAPQTETNSSDDTVLTQWFERARFEYHPANPEPSKVLLGRLGLEVHTNVHGWLGAWRELPATVPIYKPTIKPIRFDIGPIREGTGFTDDRAEYHVYYTTSNTGDVLNFTLNKEPFLQTETNEPITINGVAGRLMTATSHGGGKVTWAEWTEQVGTYRIYLWSQRALPDELRQIVKSVRPYSP